MTKSPKILVVEDSPPNRMILCHLLQKLGFDVYEACDGQEALDWLKENQADVIVTDLMMPKVDGLQLLKTIRSSQLGASIPVFIVTALGEQEAIREAKDLKCNGLFLKPLSILELRENLRPLFPELHQLKQAS